MTLRAAARLLAFAIAAACGGRKGSPGPEAGALPRHFGFGRPATGAEIRAWDIAVRPDGAGLPPGRGTPSEGGAIYVRECAACHGRTGTEGPFDRLVGREPGDSFPFGRDPSRVKTIGSYWPYATTLYDYINRAMPLNAPGSLKPNEVYSLVAFLLWRNRIVGAGAVIDSQSLPRVVMPARGRFVPDSRQPGPRIR